VRLKIVRERGDDGRHQGRYPGDRCGLERELEVVGIRLGEVVHSVAPGPMFSVSGGLERHLRLNCSLPWDDRLAEAVGLLGRLAAEQAQA
jgi:hypothetical protein